MVAKKISKYANQTDANGDQIGKWAVDVGNSKAKCKACGEKEFSYLFGKSAFTQHSATKNHKANMKKLDTKKQQVNLKEMLIGDAAQQLVEKKAKLFEIDITRRMDSHKISFSFMPCLIDCLQTHLGEESKIINKVELGRTKASYLAKNGIAKTHLDETIKKIKDSDGFSVGFDESEINKHHECEVMVMLSSKDNGIELRHYRTISLDGTDAKTIVDTLLDQMDEDKIPWRKKLIAPMTDGCNTMAGCISGVKKRLQVLVPELKDLGSCNDHHIGNAAQRGLEALDEDIKETLVNIYFDIGGAKGKGLKKKKAYEKIAKDKRRKLFALKKFGSTRFRSYRISTAPILHNWNTIVAYYSSVTKPTARQAKLKKFFVDQEFYSMLRLEFVMASTKDLNEAINFFEGRTNKIHVIREKMESVLRSQLSKFLKSDAVYDVDEDRNVVKKSGSQLLELGVYEEKNILHRKSVFIGQKCTQLLKQLDLTPNSCQLDEFYKNVYKFHQTAATKLQEYFKTGLKSRELEYMSALSPYNRTKVDTNNKILYLATSYSKILDGVAPGNGLDTLKQELELYSIDDNLNDINKAQSYNSYWGKISEVTEGEGEWQVYEVLPRLARAFGTPFNSGSEMERGFSRESDITRDPKKNRMTHETLDSHMQIHYGIECAESKQKCNRCIQKAVIAEKKPELLTEQEKKEEKKVCICHCKYSEISSTMLANCSEARKAETEKAQLNAALADEEKEDEQHDGSEEWMNRLEKLKAATAKRTTLYDPEVMKHIYETKEDKKKAAIAKRAEKFKSTASASADNDAGTRSNKEKKSTSEAQNKEKQVTEVKKTSSKQKEKQNVAKNGTSLLSSGYKIPKKTEVGVVKSKLGEKRFGKEEETEKTCERKRKKVMMMPGS